VCAEIGGFIHVAAQPEREHVLAFVAQHAEHRTVVRQLQALPGCASVARAECAAAFADYEQRAAAGARDRIQMRRGFLAQREFFLAEGIVVIGAVVFLLLGGGGFVVAVGRGLGDGHRLPIRAAIIGFQRHAVSADRIAMVDIREQHVEQRTALLRIAHRAAGRRFPGILPLQFPVFAAVRAMHDYTFVADCPDLRIHCRNGGERHARRHVCLVPVFRVVGHQDRAARADGHVAFAGARHIGQQRLRRERQDFRCCGDRIRPARLRWRVRQGGQRGGSEQYDRRGST